LTPDYRVMYSFLILTIVEYRPDFNSWSSELSHREMLW